MPAQIFSPVLNTHHLKQCYLLLSGGYIPVESVELDIQEMMVMGNIAKVANRSSVNGLIDPEASSTDVM